MCFDLNSWQNPSPPLKSLLQRASKGSERKILIDKSRAQTNGNIFFTLIFQPPPPPSFFRLLLSHKRIRKKKELKILLWLLRGGALIFFILDFASLFMNLFFALSAKRCCNKQVNFISIISSK